MANYTKTAAAVLDFTLNWASYLGFTISSSAWAVPSGITGSNQSSTATSASIRISAGTAGLVYAFTNTITMASGQIDQEPLVITVTT